MKNIVFLLCALSLMSCRKTEKYYDPYGRLTSSMEMKNGKPDGVSLFYFNDGINVYQETHYKNGKLNGYTTRWYYLSGKESEEYYVDDKLDGVRMGWYKNGRPSLEEYYSNGVLNGSSKEWFNNGQIKKETYYNNGIPTKEWHYYDNFGFELGYANFDDNGNGAKITISPDNTMKYSLYDSGTQYFDTLLVYSEQIYQQYKQKIASR